MIDIEFMSMEKLEDCIKSCEGKHVQQVMYSTYHKALTQICFDCKVVRTTMKERKGFKK